MQQNGMKQSPSHCDRCARVRFPRNDDWTFFTQITRTDC
jgi:hypothetical protein